MAGGDVRPVRINVTGSIAVACGDRVLGEQDLPGRQVRLALACLVLESSRPMQRDELAEVIWHENPPANWEKALAVVLSKLRSALQGVGLSDPALLTNAFGCYRLNLPEGTLVDVLEAASQATIAESWLQAGDTASALGAAATAAEVARRPFLVGEEGLWVDQWRAELKAILLRALDCTAEAELHDGDPRLAVRAAEEALALEPFRETGYALLMRAHAANGDRAEALRVHERCRRLLAEELGVNPSPSLEEVYVTILRADEVVGRPEPQADNLPLVPTSFIGREEEVAAVEERLAGVQLLTLTGLGGVGKTRLALEVARRVTPRFSDGVFFVDLAPLRDPAMLLPTLASSLGDVDPLAHATVTDMASAARALEVHLVTSLRSRRALILLDNCEHLADECARLCTFLIRACGDLTILATSREVLGVPGEHVYPVPPLSSDASLLFLERARAVRPDIVLGPEDASAIADICHRLDGIPLAIEFAAARLRVLTPGQISERLGDVFGLLGTPSRGMSARHHTLQAAMQWSYGLLTEHEATVLRRLSVFAGSCTLDAAEEVCAGDPVEPAEVLDVIQRLTEKSLLTSLDHRGRSRYRLHEIVRQFAHEELAASAEDADATRRRHRDWFSAQAMKVSSYMDVQPERVAESEPDAENFRAAFRWSLENGEPRAALRMATTLHGFWRAKNLIAVTVEQIEEALAALDSRPSVSKASALGLAAGIAIDHGDLDRALVLAQESLEVARVAGNEANVGWMLLGVTRARILRGEADQAEAVNLQALDLLRSAGEPVGLSWALILSARLCMARGDFDSMRDACEEIVAIGEKASQQSRSEAIALTGFWERMHGDPERGRVLCDEALTQAREGMPVHVQFLLLQMAVVDLAVERDVSRARQRLREVFELAREVRAVQLLPNALRTAAVIAGEDGRYPDAARLIGAADRLRGDTGIRSDLRTLTPLVACSTELAEKALGYDEFRRWIAHGERIGLVGAVDLALGVLTDSSDSRG